MERDGVNLLDEVIWAAQDTLQQYREHIAACRYSDARECLNAVRTLTDQAHDIEAVPKTWDGSALMLDFPSEKVPTE